MRVSYSWDAPSWAGAESYPVVYEHHEGLLFACAMFEETLPSIQRQYDLACQPRKPRFPRPPRGRKGDLGYLLRSARAVLEGARTLLEQERTGLELGHALDHKALQFRDAVHQAAHRAGIHITKIMEVEQPWDDLRVFTRKLMPVFRAHLEPRAFHAVQAALRVHLPALEELRNAERTLPRISVVDARAARLEDKASLLVLDAFSHGSIRERRVPRVHGEQVDTFMLGPTALYFCSGAIRTLAKADVALFHKRGTAAQRAQLTQLRQTLVSSIERVAGACARQDAWRAAKAAGWELQQLVWDTARMWRRPFPEVDAAEAALDLLAYLAGRKDAAAVQTAARLSALLAVPPPDGDEPPRETLKKADHQVTMELEQLLVRVQHAG